VIFRGKKWKKTCQTFSWVIFWKDLLLLLLKDSILALFKGSVKVFSSSEFKFSFSTFGFGVGLEGEC
jgi:hypothetical protein